MIDKNLDIYSEPCTGCSACTEACLFPSEEGILPINLINNNNLMIPEINHDICVECMACYKACPNEEKLQSSLTFEEYKAMIGNCYYGYSLDEEHRYNSATGGIVTEIASYLLDKKLVDGVLSSYQDEDNNIVSKIFTESSKIKQSNGSIYRQVNLLNGLEKKLADYENKTILVIGLPCHILGLSKLKAVKSFRQKKINFLTISIFCKQTKQEEFSDFIRNLLDVKEKKSIRYRGNGWPGSSSIENKNILTSNPKLNLFWSSYAFTPEYCFSCNDPLGLIADISVGDAWLKEYLNDTIGSSLFIANTQIGKIFLNDMVIDKRIYYKEETRDNIILSQGYKQIHYKFNKKKNDYKFIFINKYIIEVLFNYGVVKYLPNVFVKICNKLIEFYWTKIYKVTW